MLYDKPMTTEDKYNKLVHMVDSVYRMSRSRMEVEYELYMLERDEDAAERHHQRYLREHEVYKAIKTLDDYIDLLEQVPTEQ